MSVIFEKATLTGDITTPTLTVSGSASIAPMRLSGNITVSTGAEPYSGTYEITPTTQMQVLNTKDRILAQNITINPIPSNYGLITWNGATLTVS